MVTEPRQLRSYQTEAVNEVLIYWANHVGQRSTPVVVLPTGTGKPLHDDTEIPTPGGYARMGDIRPGGYVLGGDGRPTRVLAVDPQGEIDLYRVTFDDGAYVLAGAGHLWQVQRKGRKPRIMSTVDILAAGFKDNDGYMWRVPVAGPSQFMERGLPLDPYLVGSLLANGHVVHGEQVKLTTPDTVVVDELRRRGIEVKDATYSNNCPQWSFPGLSHAITRSGIRGNLSKNKFIPEVYLTAGESDRWDLFRGLMDGDGSTRSGGRRSVLYHTCSPRLARDVKSLAWSLGVRASVASCSREHEGKPREFTVHLLPPIGVSLFLTRRKNRDDTPRRAFSPRRSIVSIEREGTGPATCIQVAADNGLFCATRDYIVTHNSTIIATLAVAMRRQKERVVLLAHRQELLDQMAASVMAVDPDGQHVGIVQGTRNDPSTDIVAASFQTLQNDARLESLGHRGIVLVDEMHHSTAETYMGVLNRLGVLDGTAQACGFTATASRSDGGLGQVWDSIVYERSLRWAIQQGYLTAPRGLTVVLPDLDLSQVTVRAGDYATGELETVMSSSVETTVVAMLTHAAGRASIVFAAGVEHARELAEALTRHGVPARAVTGDMSADDRSVVYEGFRNGELDALVTVQVLTEGADFPRCDCAVMARPTRSQTLYSQMVGRAVRLYPGKSDALVLDLAGTVRDMSLVTLSDLDPEAPARRVASNSDDDPGQDEPVAQERKQRIGVAELEDIDLLATSPVNWLTTNKGVRFIDCQDALVFLWPPNPAPDTASVMVGLSHKSRPEMNGWQYNGVSGTLEQATEAAERLGDIIGTLPSREASWRKRSTPSDAQVRLARALGVPDADNKTKARLSDDISTVKASRVLDTMVN